MQILIAVHDHGRKALSRDRRLIQRGQDPAIVPSLVRLVGHRRDQNPGQPAHLPGSFKTGHQTGIHAEKRQWPDRIPVGCQRCG